MLDTSKSLEEQARELNTRGYLPLSADSTYVLFATQNSPQDKPAVITTTWAVLKERQRLGLLEPNETKAFKDFGKRDSGLRP